MKSTILICASTLFLLTGCEAQQADAPPVNAMSEFEGMAYATSAPTQSREVLRERLQTKRAAFGAIERAIDGIPLDQPEEADRAIQRAVQQLPRQSRVTAEQVGAGVMIDVFLGRAPDSPATQELAAQHTLRLVEASSPEASLVLDGIREVGDYWDGETRRSVAQRAVGPAAEWIVAQRSKRPGSPSARLVATEMDPRLARTEAAVAELRQMVEGR